MNDTTRVWLGAWLAVLALLVGGARAGTGDVNADGSVTRADATLALRVAGGGLAPTFAQYAAGSVTADSAITIADALRILRVARGLDPAPPASAMPIAFSLTVSANATRNVALPGGYTVAGRARDRVGSVFLGRIAFRETDSETIYGPFDLDDLGDYVAVLPPGEYQAIALAVREFAGGLGEPGASETALAMGSPFTVSANQTGRNFTRPDLAAPFTVSFDFAGPSEPFLVSTDIVLSDTGETPATFGWNRLEAEFLSTPASRPVPRGTYFVDARTTYPLSSGIYQGYNLYFEVPLEVTRNTSRTLTFPTLYELDGDFTGAAALNAVDVLAQQVPVAGRDVAEALVNASGLGYLMAMPRGALTLSVGVATPFEETMAERLLNFTMPTDDATKDINLPALPTFRAITGLVLGPDGKPAANALVAADSEAPATIPSAGVYLFHARTTTDEDGRYTMNLPNGPYTVNVTP